MQTGVSAGWPDQGVAASVDASAPPTLKHESHVSADRGDLKPSFRSMTKADAAYADIRLAIIDGRLAPGERIDQDNLARSLGCSVTPIREALRWLSAEGLVHRPAHREVAVAHLSMQGLIDLYNLRLLLDPFAASLSARNAPPETRRSVLELAAEPIPASRQRWIAHDRDFHRTIYAASGNNVLTGQLDSLWDRSSRYALVIRDSEYLYPTLREEHIEIADAFSRSNYETIARLMHNHIATAFDRLMNAARADNDLFNSDLGDESNDA